MKNKKTVEEQIAEETCTKNPSPARASVLSHLKRIVKAGVFAGAAFGAGGGCDDQVVCDPLPPPIQCTDDANPNNIQYYLNVRATWSGTQPGAIDGTASSRVPDELQFLEAITYVDATAVSMSLNKNEMKFTCTPNAGVTHFQVNFSFSCDGKTVQSTVYLSWQADDPAKILTTSFYPMESASTGPDSGTR